MVSSFGSEAMPRSFVLRPHAASGRAPIPNYGFGLGPAGAAAGT
jgi:hypothetical protein